MATVKNMHKKITTADFKKMKKESNKITMLTAYDYPTAKILDASGIDAILVGDSLGMAVLGYEDTTQVTMEDMIHHTRAVSRGVNRSFVVADMPFLSYHISEEEAIKNAGKLIQKGKAQAVKLEGGESILPKVRSIIQSGIPVMGHLGLTPQSIHQLGGYFIQGKTQETAKTLLEDAKKLETAGVFAIVLECVPSEVSKFITDQLTIPTIGIGAGNQCDGQILVIHDVIGMYQGKVPKFVKQYADVGNIINSSISQYIYEVKKKSFPDEKYQFHVEDRVIDILYKGEE